MIPYGRQDITDADIAAVTAALKSDFLTTGPRIAEFEAAFADYIGAPYAVAVSSGTAALHLAALALGVAPGQRVITSPLTFSATANCIRYCGGEPVFADIDPATGLLDIEAVRLLIESQPAGTFSGIMPIDYAGYPVDMAAFRELADRHGLWIIEDACHAPGGKFKSQGEVYSCGDGSLAELAIFSFHPVKHITSGEGGMITTADEKLYRSLKRLRTHGITKEADILLENHGGWYYEMHELGYNYRMTDIAAALGSSQLERADAMLERRRELARRYDAAFEGTAVRTVAPQAGAAHAYHLYVVLLEDRKRAYDHLRQQKIFSQVHYVPVHYLPYYQKRGWKKGDFLHAENFYRQCLSLPLFPALSHQEQDFVIQTLTEII